MKAILIVDVDDNTDFSKAKANITMAEDKYGVLLGNVGKKWYKDVSLRPMPKKEKGLVSFQTRDGVWHKPDEIGYVGGWNACIDEILGEEEE